MTSSSKETYEMEMFDCNTNNGVVEYNKKNDL